jgi:hypothetical protein
VFDGITFVNFDVVYNNWVNSIICINIIIFSGSAAQRGLWPPRPRGFLITRHDSTQSVGLIWTSDQLVAETSTWQHTHTHNKHPCPGGIFFLYHSWPFWPFLTVFYHFDLLVIRVTNMGQIILLPLPKEGLLWIFPSGKIRRLRSGANRRSCVPETNMQTPRPPKPLGFDPWTVQPVVSRYTDWASRPTL